MLTHPFNYGVWISIALAGFTHAHMAGFHPAMYCVNGSDPNRYDNEAVNPLTNMTFDEYWLHGKCIPYPPPSGVFLELYAGQSFTVEWAENKAFTSLNPHANLTKWGDGREHPDDYSVTNTGGYNLTTSGCLSSPNMHTQDQAHAAGTAFAISYESDITKVTLNNTVVFSVASNTPFYRVVTYDVPEGMPPCPPEGCNCVGTWIPDGCGIANQYFTLYPCRVHPGSTPSKTIGSPNAPVWCEDDLSKCVKGPKQVMVWHQQEGNNIDAPGVDSSGAPNSPGYNSKCGFQGGAQNDIFVDSSTSTGTVVSGSMTPTASLPAGSSAPTLNSTASLPTGSSTPTLNSTASLPTGSSTPTLNSTASLPTGSSAQTLNSTTSLPIGSCTPISNSATSLPTGSSTPTLNSTTNLPTGSSTPTLNSTASLPTGSSTPTLNSTASLPAVSGTPTLNSTGSLPTGSSTPTLNSTGSLPTGSSTPTLNSTASLPTGSSTPTLKSTASLPTGSSTATLNSTAQASRSTAPVCHTAPAPSVPAGSGTPTDSNTPVGSSTHIVAGRAAHSKRMMTQREKRNIF